MLSLGVGNSKLCAFLKRGRNSAYHWGLYRQRGRCVFKIWISRLPERIKRKQYVQFLHHHCNRTVFPGYSCVSQIKVSESMQPEQGWQIKKIAEDIWFSYLYLKLRFTFACTNYIQSTSITSDHVVSITQTNTLQVLLTLTQSLQFWCYLQFKSGIVKYTVLDRQY